MGGRKFCRVALGSDSSQVEVHNNFKFVLICTKKEVTNMDKPLLNRFEKHRLINDDFVNV